jgi:HAD superfamily hydrolase (TIGR01509 family)
MNGIKGLVFDCDGVLFESRTANLAYYNTVLQLLGEAPVAESDNVRSHLCHTAASPQVFMQLLGEERTAEALAVAAGLDYRQFIPFMTPEPGILETLTQLAGCYPLAVATNRGYSMASILEHFGLSDFFRAVVTSRDVVHPKPAPDMLYEAAKRLQHEPHELLFIGDSELDQAAARSAKMPFAIYHGDLQADVRLEHHGELLGIFIKDVVCGVS